MKYGLTKEEVIKILEFCKTHNLSRNNACKELGYPEYTNIGRYIKKYSIQVYEKNNNPTGYKARKYNVDDYFFHIPNVINSYYAGFIAADGYICSRKSELRTLKIGLSSKDTFWLEDFKNHLCSESPIKIRVQKELYEIAEISITSKQIIDDLHHHFNICPRKSLILEPPLIDEKPLKYAFICGYIDGDGSIFLSDRNKINKTLCISILGTQKMCEWIKEVFNDITNGCGTIKPKPNTNIYRLDYSCKAAREIVKVLSKIKVPKLQRKWTKEIINHSENFVKGHNHTTKKVYIFNLNGELIKKCNSVKEASSFSGVTYSLVSKILNDSRYKQSKGYVFKKKIEENND